MNKGILALLLVLFALGIGLCFYTQWEWALQMLIAGAVMAVIIALKSRKEHNNNVQTNLAELITIFGITMSPRIMDGISPFVDNFRNLVNTHAQLEWVSLDFYENLSYIIAILLMYLLVSLASKLSQDKTIMQRHRGKLLAPFNDEAFKRKRKNFCKALEIDLKKIDIATEWNEDYFAPLKADVIVEEFNKTRKISCDLMKALETKSNEKAYLVLGEPGSGKSTVLRKLAGKLLDEVNKTNKIPLYINLKEWDTTEEFNESNPPKIHHLVDFIRDNLKERLGETFVSNFLDDYFYELYQQGFFYFIFDSFDEIPMLLDEPEKSWMVDQISSLLYQIAASNGNGKVILSSRFFRQPTEQYQAYIKLQIKPFSEASIKQCFERIVGSSQLAVKVYSQHIELLSIAQNPFYASLISSYYKYTQQIPVKEIELYEWFINYRLEQCEKSFSLLSQNSVSKSEVILYSQRIAAAIFENPKYGIEIPRAVLLREFDIPDYVIEILQKSKLIRVGSGAKKAVSFSHRRFNEYFVACSLMAHNIDSYIKSIPSDSKWRDTLVLYAQICPDDKAISLIEFCCSFFKKLKKPKNDKEKTHDSTFYESIHSLRFLVAAFSNQPDKLLTFQKLIYKFVRILIDEPNILFYKIAIQTIPILSHKNRENFVGTMLERNIPWLNDDVILGCLYLKKISTSIYLKILRYFTFMGNIKFITSYSQFSFYLSMSTEFKSIQNICRIKRVNLCFTIFLMIIIPIIASIMKFFIGSDVHEPYIMSFFLVSFMFTLTEAITYLAPTIPRSPESRVDGNYAPFSYDLASHLAGSFLWNIAVLALTVLLIVLPKTLSAISDGTLASILAVIALTMPKVDIYFYITAYRKNRTVILKRIKKYIKKNWKELLAILSVIIVFAASVTLTAIYIPPAEQVSPIGFVALAIMLLLALYYCSLYIRNLTSDRHKLKLTDYFPAMEKRVIYETLSSLSTNYYQTKYLINIQSKNVQILENSVYLSLPKLNSHNVYEMLARIEERFL